LGYKRREAPLGVTNPLFGGFGPKLQIRRQSLNDRLKVFHIRHRRRVKRRRAGG
jgi:hypothetical protein